MSFFYDLNKKLDGIRATPEVTHKQLNERDLKSASTSALKAAVGKDREADKKSGVPANYSTKQVKDELKTRDVEEGMSRAAKGYEKYGKEGMEALAKAGREGKALDPVRAKYDKYDNTEVDEGQMLDKFVNSKIGQKILGKPSDANKLSPSTAGHSFGKGQVTPGGPLGQIARSNMNKNEGAHSQDAMKLNPDFDKIGRKPGVMGKIGSGLKKVADVIAPGDDELLDRLEKSSGAAPRQPGAKEPRYMEAMSPAKQKSFAALAPPKDKITFADKIAGAKKEVDEMLGDVAAEAMKSALSGGQKKLDKNKNGKLDAMDFEMLRKGGKQETDEASQDNAFTAHKRARAETPKVGTITHGSKHDVEEIPGGRRVTRRTDAQGISVGADDDKPADGEKRSRGRPKGPEKAPERVTGGATKHKGGRKTNEGSDYGQAQQIYDDLADVRAVAKQAQRGGEFPQGFASRLESVLYAAMTLIKNQQSGGAQVSEQELDEKAVSKKQQKFMGMVHAAQKGEKPASGEVAKTAKTMGKKDAKDFAATKHKGLPEKKKSEDKKKEVDETSDNTPGKSSGGFKFGGGIYDSINRDLELMISESMSRLDESMSINMSMNNDEHGGPTRSLTVTATDDDATKLAQLLKSAGLGGSDHSYHTMDENYGVNEVSQNTPDYPTNTETAQDNFEYSGGLNKPKSTGQTTVPVIASQEERQYTQEGSEYDEMQDKIQWLMGAPNYFKPDEAREAAAYTPETDSIWNGYREDTNEDPIARMMEMAGVKKAKPDFLDVDKDGDKKEPFKKAASEKEKQVDESIFAMTANLWKTYKG
jgi:hypothetical protein